MQIKFFENIEIYCVVIEHDFDKLMEKKNENDDLWGNKQLSRDLINKFRD